jgi:hypothetical protein
MGDFYNMIRQWFNPTKHAGLLPTSAEEILNLDARQVGIWYEPSVVGFAFMHLWKNSRSRKLAS